MTPVLELRGLTKSFGGLVAVNAMSFELMPGEIMGLIGPNGSGKTTTLNLISGALSRDEGTIRLDGEDVAALPAHRRCRAGIARTFQLVRLLPGLTVLDNVTAGRLFAGRPAASPKAGAEEAMHWLDRVGIAHRAAEPADQLTYIDQKRVELARALATRPQLLLLDEWLSGLNPTELIEGIELVRRVAADVGAVILVEHVMAAVRALCGSVVVMNAGARIAAGPPDAVLRDPEVVRAYLGGEDA